MDDHSEELEEFISENESMQSKESGLGLIFYNDAQYDGLVSSIALKDGTCMTLSLFTAIQSSQKYPNRTWLLKQDLWKSAM
jgi:hypothetical protein